MAETGTLFMRVKDRLSRLPNGLWFDTNDHIGLQFQTSLGRDATLTAVTTVFGCTRWESAWCKGPQWTQHTSVTDDGIPVLVYGDRETPPDEIP